LPYGANVLPEPKIMLVPTLRSNLAQGSDEDRFIGTGKSVSQFKGIDAKEKLVLTQPGSKSGIPLILFGFLW